MARILCEAISDGLRASEAVAAFRDHQGRRHFIRVERDFLTEDKKGGVWLPVGVVQIDPASNMTLVELSHEAETGANRVWIKPESVEVT